MQGRLEAWFPNVMARLPEFYNAFRDTLTMFGIAGAFVLLRQINVIGSINGAIVVLRQTTVIGSINAPVPL